MHTQLASGGRIEAVHLKQQPIVMRLIALLLVSVFSLAAPSVSRASFRVVHVFVALADNQHQGIIPVPPALGNGRDPQRNLYWGAAYGVKTYFKASEDWGLAWSGRGAQDAILKRCVFKSSKNQSNQVGRNGFSFRGCRYRQTKTFTQDALRGGFHRHRGRCGSGCLCRA